MIEARITVDESTKELARTIIILSREHKDSCDGSCDISLFPLRYLVAALLGRELTIEESENFI